VALAILKSPAACICPAKRSSRRTNRPSFSLHRGAAPTSAPTAGPPRYPFLSISVANTTSTSLRLRVGLSRAGYVWCIAQSSRVSPGGAAIKARTSGVPVTQDGGNVTVAIGGLTALMRYYTFCYGSVVLLLAPQDQGLY
jgi:hypothetical protein